MKSSVKYAKWLTRITIVLTVLGLVCVGRSLASTSGVVLSFGDNGVGQTGLGNTSGETLVATPIDTTNLGGVTVTRVAAGNAHSLLVVSDGSAFTFGLNGNGQAGLGSTVNALVATAIDTTNLAGKTVTSVGGGESHSLLVADGAAFSFGFNGAGRTGLGFDDNGNTLSATPIDTINLLGATVTQTSAGFRHSLLLTNDGDVYSFGANVAGATGLGTTVNNTFVATALDTTHLGDAVVKDIAAGERFSLILDDDGTAYSFGANDVGQGGLGPVLGTAVATPIDTTNLTGKTITQVAAGRFHSLLLADDGTVFSFGSNAEGQTGLGIDVGVTNIATQIDTTNLDGKTITKVAAGDRLSLLLTDDGSVFSFGSNRFGQTGLGTASGWTTVATPIDATHLEGMRVTDIAAGHGHGLLLATPVPEPGSMVLLLLAGSAFCIVTFRRASLGISLAILFAALLLTSGVAWADHKTGHGGVGGKPGGDTGAGELQLVELDPNGLAYAVNSAGVVAGSSNGVAGYWNAGDADPSFAPLPGGSNGFAYAVNDAGQFAGGTQGLPTYWASSTAEPFSLTVPTGFTRGWANGISDNGVIVGELDDGDELSAAVWRVVEDAVIGPAVLGVAGANGVASMSSNADRIVGRAADDSFGHIAAAWNVTLHTDGSFDVGDAVNLALGQSAEAFAVAEDGDATGIIKWGGGVENTAFLIRHGTMELLPSGGRNQYGVGYDLNSTDVVGVTARSRMSDAQIATQWDSRGRRHDLTRDFFGDDWTTTVARGINDEEYWSDTDQAAHG